MTDPRHEEGAKEEEGIPVAIILFLFTIATVLTFCMTIGAAMLVRPHWTAHFLSRDDECELHHNCGYEMDFGDYSPIEFAPVPILTISIQNGLEIDGEINRFSAQPPDQSWLLRWDKGNLQIPWPEGLTAREAIIQWAKEQWE